MKMIEIGKGWLDQKGEDYHRVRGNALPGKTGCERAREGLGQLNKKE